MRISDWSSDVCSSDLTTGGAILYYPTAPSYELEGYAMVAYGNYDARIAEGALNLPVVDGKAALRIAGQYQKRDGWTKNIGIGEDADDLNSRGLRVSLLLEPLARKSTRLNSSQ